jgi:chromosome segregation ATPase
LKLLEIEQNLQKIQTKVENMKTTLDYEEVTIQIHNDEKQDNVLNINCNQVNAQHSYHDVLLYSRYKYCKSLLDEFQAMQKQSFDYPNVYSNIYLGKKQHVETNFTCGMLIDFFQVKEKRYTKALKTVLGGLLYVKHV